MPTLAASPANIEAFEPWSTVEIVDDVSGQVIREPYREGVVLISSFARKLMPVLRYPSGDRAMWVEEANVLVNRKFKLLGRSEEAARVGPVSLYYEDVGEILKDLREQLPWHSYQLVVEHDEQKDRLRLLLAVSDPGSFSTHRDQVLALLFEKRPMLQDLWRQGKFISPQIEFCASSDLERHPRTGKLKRIVDRRF